MTSVFDGNRRLSGLVPLSREVAVPDERESPWVVDLSTGRIVRRSNCAEAGAAPVEPRATAN